MTLEIVGSIVLKLHLDSLQPSDRSADHRMAFVSLASLALSLGNFDFLERFHSRQVALADLNAGRGFGWLRFGQGRGGSVSRTNSEDYNCGRQQSQIKHHPEL